MTHTEPIRPLSALPCCPQEEGAATSIDAVVGAALEMANSKDWLQQGQGLDRISKLAQQGCLAQVGYACAGSVVECVAQLLAESNVKVGLQALEVCARCFECNMQMHSGLSGLCPLVVVSLPCTLRGMYIDGGPHELKAPGHQG